MERPSRSPPSLARAHAAPTRSRPDSTALGADSTLNRDLALANRDTAAQPQLKDVPRANAPSRDEPRKRPEPRAHAARQHPTPSRSAPQPPCTTTTPSGNTVTTNPARREPAHWRRCGRHDRGRHDAQRARGVEDLHEHQRRRRSRDRDARQRGLRLERRDDSRGRDGQPDGDAAQAQRERERSDRHGVRGELGDVRRQDLPDRRQRQSAPTVDRVKDQPTGKDVQKVGIGAVAGAIAGRIIGKSTKATVIGGAVGAAAGAATAAATANYQGCIQSGGHDHREADGTGDCSGVAGAELTSSIESLEFTVWGLESGVISPDAKPQTVNPQLGRPHTIRSLQHRTWRMR